MRGLPPFFRARTCRHLDFATQIPSQDAGGPPDTRRQMISCMRPLPSSGGARPRAPILILVIVRTVIPPPATSLPTTSLNSSAVREGVGTSGGCEQTESGRMTTSRGERKLQNLSGKLPAQQHQASFSLPARVICDSVTSVFRILSGSFGFILIPPNSKSRSSAVLSRSW